MKPSGSNQAPVVQSGQQYGPEEAYGPPTPETPQTYGPEPLQVHPVVLVLGPGLARGFAYAGVLHVLHDQKIPVGAIVGAEVGGLLGALYARDANINHFDWALMKLKEDDFIKDQSLLGTFATQSGVADRFQNDLKQIFRGKEIKDLRIPLWLAIRYLNNKTPVLIESGALEPALRSAMASPVLYPPGMWQGAETVSVDADMAELVKDAKGLGIGPVVAVRVKDRDVLNYADVIIEPDLSGIEDTDFSRRSEATFRGKTAALKKAQELRHLVGLPPGDFVLGGAAR